MLFVLALPLQAIQTLVGLTKSLLLLLLWG